MVTILTVIYYVFLSERKKSRRRRQRDRVAELDLASLPAAQAPSKKKTSEKRNQETTLSLERVRRNQETLSLGHVRRHQDTTLSLGSLGRVRRSITFDEHDVHHMTYHANLCNHHLIDYCAWPQCNFACPKIRNDLTGEEMDFIDLLMQFGLDLSGIANALGMDLHTLQSMDHDVLIRIMLQNSG